MHGWRCADRTAARRRRPRVDRRTRPVARCGERDGVEEKIRETSAIFAEALSAADLRHGPIAAVTPDVPVLAFSAPGPAAADVAALCVLLRERGVTVSVVSPERGADLTVPPGVPEALQPVVAAVRGQQIALSAALARHRDPDAPAGLTKVTLTR